MLQHLLRITLWTISVCWTLTAGAQTFQENKGQWPEQVTHLSRLTDADIWLEDAAVVIQLHDPLRSTVIHDHDHEHDGGTHDFHNFEHHAYRMRFIDASAEGSSVGRAAHRGVHNYFIGNDPTRWARDVRSFSEVRRQEIYEGIDCRYYYNEKGRFKYDLIIEPGHSPSIVSLSYEGVRPELTDEGEIRLETAAGPVIEGKPYAYQIIDGEQVEVRCDYTLSGGIIGFDLGAYEETLPLVIDPELVFSTYSGSFSDNFGFTATFDRLGFLYAGSAAFGPQFPTTMGAYNELFNGGQVDIAITKYDTTGTSLVYSTYLGGSLTEAPHSIIVNDNDELYVFGTTGSSDFPTTAEAYDTSFEGGPGVNVPGIGSGYQSGCDIIISRLSSDGGGLLSSTFVGGSRNDGLNLSEQTLYNYADELRGEIELDDDGNVLVATSTVTLDGTNDFPTTSGALFSTPLGGTQDGVIFRLSPDLSSLDWSTYFGGSGNDAAFSVATSESGRIIVTGGTNSQDLPTTPAVVSPTFQGGETDAYVAVLSPTATQLLSCTYWGTPTYDQAYMVELDRFDNIHLFGQTLNGDGLIVNAQFSVANSGQFISKLNLDLDEIIWSTAFGNGNGLPNISPTAFAVDVCSRVYLSGWGGPTGNDGLTTEGLPLTPDAFQSTTDGADFYLLALTDDAGELEYGSFFGGDESNEHVDGGTSRFDKKGNVYQSVCAGCGSNDDFPIFPADAVSATNNSPNCNNGVFKLDFELPAIISDFNAPTVCLPDSTPFSNTSLGGLTFDWDFGDGATSEEFAPTHLYEAPGVYEVQLIISDPLSCNLADTVIYPVNVTSSQPLLLDTLLNCAGDPIQIGLPPIGSATTYEWSLPEFLDQSTISNPIATIDTTTTFEVIIDFGLCVSESQQTVVVEFVDLELLSEDTLICDGGEVTLTSTAVGSTDTYTWSDSPDFDPVLSTDSFLVATPLIGSTYYVRTGDNCFETASVEVLLASEQISFSQDRFICSLDTVSLSVSNAYPAVPITVDWSPDAAILSGDLTPTIVVAPEQSTTYTALVENAYGCLIEDSIAVEVSALSFETVTASADTTTIAAGGSVTIMASPPEGYDYQWSPTAGVDDRNASTTLVTPPATTTYIVEITDSDINGFCTKTDSVTIKRVEFVCGFPIVFLPNAFTPNGDGDNDVLFVRGPLLTEVDLSIYDRWGQLVFQTTDRSVGWDGSLDGRPLDPDVYVYHLRIVCQDGQEAFDKGNITLIR